MMFRSTTNTIDQYHRARVWCYISVLKWAEKSVALAVGADGLRSKVREISFSSLPTPTCTGQIGILWSIPCSEPKRPSKNASHSPAGVSSEANSMVTSQGVVLFVPDMRFGT